MHIDKFAFFRKIGYEPHVGQLRMHRSPARYRLLACGSRWGKSKCASRELMYAMLKPDSRYWALSGTYDLANKVFREVLWTWLHTRPDFIEKYSERDMYIRTVIDSELFGKSADKPEGLLGESLDGAVFDEPPICQERIWQEFLQARLIDRRGWCMFTGTAKGKGWYHLLYQRGKKEDPDFFSTEGPSWENPLVSKQELLQEKAKGYWSDRYWRQEILGEFLDDSGSVFKNIRAHVTGMLHEPKGGEVYSIGADLAKHRDWTVITVMDSTGHVVYWERIDQGTSWPVQKLKIGEISRKFNNATCYVDSSGVGDPIVDDLSAMGVSIMPVPTAQQKVPLIDALTVALENNRITFPELPVLINELETFEHDKTGTGRDTYNAPVGFHDDAVISLALAWRGINNAGGFASAKIFRF
jgi:hypothetical protein